MRLHCKISLLIQRFCVALKSTTFLKARPAFPLAVICTPRFSSVRAFRSSPLSMGDSPKADGMASSNGHAVAPTPASLADYSFPEGRMKTLSHSTKTPVVLMACGSLSVLEYYSKATFCYIDVFTAPRSPFSTFVSRCSLRIHDHEYQASSGLGTCRVKGLTRILCRSVRNGQRLY